MLEPANKFNFIQVQPHRYIDPAKGFECKDVPIPKVAPGHVLIKVLASPIGTDDEAFATGVYPISDTHEPICVGCEGVGEVVEVGPDVPASFKGKRVIFCTSPKQTPEQFGCWCQFALLHHENCIVIEGTHKPEETCGLYGNPLTVLAMLDLIRRKKQKAIINTAAASSLGRMLLEVCQKEGIEVICIVRKNSSAEQLRALGAKYVLDQSKNDEEFMDALTELCTKLDVHMCFDAVGGTLTGKLLRSMPPNSTVYVYGMLGGEIQGIHQVLLILQKQKIKGFTVMYSEFAGDPAKTRQRYQSVLDDIKAGRRTFLTRVGKTYRLSECKEAVAKYLTLAEHGKSVFLPHA